MYKNIKKTYKIKKKYCYYCKNLMKLNTKWYYANDKLFCCKIGQYLEIFNLYK